MHFVVPTRAAVARPEDPYLWLENVSGRRSLAWVAKQDARSKQALAGDNEFKVMDKRFRKILDSGEKIPFVEKIGEYGDPDQPQEWAYLRGFSPYHNTSRDAVYPPTLFTSSTRDDRVHPGHARKMVAKLQAEGHETLYYENVEGGHEGAADNAQRAFMSALAYSFLWRHLK
jgi:prolyl oligopeptidase PreP (S9A serine peptidase family)